MANCKQILKINSLPLYSSPISQWLTRQGDTTSVNLLEINFAKQANHDVPILLRSPYSAVGKHID